MVLTGAGLAEHLHAELLGDGSAVAHSVESVERANHGQLTFVRDIKNWERWLGRGATGASLVLVGQGLREHIRQAAIPAGAAVLLVKDADLALAKVLEEIEQSQLLPGSAAGAHPSAVIHPTAKVDPSASIGPGCTIGPAATIGARALLRERVTIGPECQVGDGCVLHPGVVLYQRTVLGNRVIVHANAVLGADGFGYRPDAAARGLVKIPHTGNVVIGDDVEIGANTCIDRAKFGSTSVGAGSKIDNLVQIGHGCQIGRSVVICGQVGLAGSVTIGDGAMLGGQAGVADQRQIGSGAMVAAQAGVESDVAPKARVIGTPAEDAKEAITKFYMLSKLVKHRTALAKLFKSLGE